MRPAAMLSMLAMFAALLAACDSRDSAVRQEPETATGDSVRPSCLPIQPDVRGTLAGQREAAQREARRVRVAGDGATQAFENGRVTIHPACGSHTFRVEDLARGQFVARLTIEGRVDSLSRIPDDTVFWWVYLDVSSGRPVYQSEYLSLAAREEGAHIQRDGFVIRCKAPAARDTTERAAWEPAHEPEACPDTTSAARTRTAQGPAPRTPTPAAFASLPALPRATMALLQSGSMRAWYACPYGCCQGQKDLQ